MKVGIIGAGFCGLAAAYKISKAGFQVKIFEKESRPGGLAIGFKRKGWKWSAEQHYHHLFVSDVVLRNLAKDIGHEIIFQKSKTSVFIKGGIYSMDSVKSLLLFPHLSFFDRLRTGITLFYLRISPFWKPLENIPAQKFIIQTMGKKCWKILWKSLFEGKFGKFSKTVPASWFWARISKRSKTLGYPEGGFGELAKRFERAIIRMGGKFYYQTGISQINKKGEKFQLTTEDGKKITLDKIICTLPSRTFCNITQGLPSKYLVSQKRLKFRGAVNLVLILKQQFLIDRTYWLNINDAKFPFLVIVEQTNFINPSNYSQDRIVYVGNYLESTHPYFAKTAKELLSEFTSYLKKINPHFRQSWVQALYVFYAPFAQPIPPLGYSKILPSFNTPISGLYLANIEQVYPWDRGTNFAVELGERVAASLLSD